jgi:hypothetical protein
MTFKKFAQLIITLLIIALLALSPFLPGPSFLSGFAKFFYSTALVLSCFSILFLPFGLWLIIVEMKRKVDNREYSFRLSSFFAFSISLTLIICVFLGYKIRNFSRNIAISQANKIVVALETYRDANNVYPNELINLQPKYLKTIPSSQIIGIPSFQYENLDSTYRLFFKQEVLFDYNYELVSYNPHEDDNEEEEFLKTGDKNWAYYIVD